MTFFAVSFAFLGLSSAGVYSYFKFKANKEMPSLSVFAKYFNLFGLFFIHYFIIWTILQSGFVDDLMNKIILEKKGGFLNLLEVNFLLFIIESLVCGLYFSVCFFFLGLAASFVYRFYSAEAHKLYFFDLLGAGCGCIFMPVVLSWVDFSSIPILLGLLAFITAYLVARQVHSSFTKYTLVFIILLCSLLTYWIFRKSFYDIRINPYFVIQDYEHKGDAEEIWVGWNAYSRVSLVRAKPPEKKNFRYVFSIDNVGGRALLNAFNPDNPFPVKLFDGFNATTLSFLLNDPKDMLIIFAGAGRDMLEAYSYSKGKANITGVEINPLIVKTALNLPQFHLKEFFGKENINMVVQEGRNYLESTNKLYDSILYSWAGASFADYLGVTASVGQYLYTKEAFVSLLKHLKPDGTIAIANGNKLKLVAMAKEAFEDLGYDNFNKHLLIFDSKKNINSGMTLNGLMSSMDKQQFVIKKSEYTKEEIDFIATNLHKMNLDWIQHPFFTHPDFKIYNQVLSAKNTRRLMLDLSRKYSVDPRYVLMISLLSVICFFWRNFAILICGRT